MPWTVTLAQGDGHFSRMPVARHLQRPNPRTPGGQPFSPMRGIALLFGLAPGGVCQASPVTRAAGELLPHRFTLAVLRRRSIFCGTIRGVAPPGRYPAPCPVEPGLSSRHDRGGGRPSRFLWCPAKTILHSTTWRQLRDGLVAGGKNGGKVWRGRVRACPSGPGSPSGQPPGWPPGGCARWRSA